MTLVNKTRTFCIDPTVLMAKSCFAVQLHCAKSICSPRVRGDGCAVSVPDVRMAQRRTHVALYEEPVDKEGKSRFAARHHSVE